MNFIQKISFLTISFFAINTAFALDGKALSKALNSALNEASVEIDLETISSFQTILEDHEIEVAIQYLNKSNSKKELLEYGCHLHGEEMACHEEGEHHFLDHPESETDINFSQLLDAHKEALVKLEKTLKRRKTGLESLTSLKVWKHSEERRGGHEHGTDVWTKATYVLNGKEKTTFIQCHQHDGESKFYCHYQRSGEGEPEL